MPPVTKETPALIQRSNADLMASLGIRRLGLSVRILWIALTLATQMESIEPLFTTQFTLTTPL